MYVYVALLPLWARGIDGVRLFGAGSAEPRWLVGLTFESAPAGVEGMQKVVNDILSQTG